MTFLSNSPPSAPSRSKDCGGVYLPRLWAEREIEMSVQSTAVLRAKIDDLEEEISELEAAVGDSNHCVDDADGDERLMLLAMIHGVLRISKRTLLVYGRDGMFSRAYECALDGGVPILNETVRDQIRRALRKAGKR